MKQHTIGNLSHLKPSERVIVHRCFAGYMEEHVCHLQHDALLVELHAGSHETPLAFAIADALHTAIKIKLN